MPEDGGVNYVKTHDGGLQQGKGGIVPGQDWQYLLQYRHPIESIQSLFEFALFHENDGMADTAACWNVFLEDNLAYWRAFVTKWCLALDEGSVGSVHTVEYRALCAAPVATVRSTVAFLLRDDGPIDERRLQRAVERFSGSITRYAEHQRAGIETANATRRAEDFRYFDARLLRIEEELYDSYLAPLGIMRLGEKP